MSIRRYSSIGDQTATATATILGVTTDGNIRPIVYEVQVGSGATPADQASVIQVIRTTAAGTGTAVTPTPHDPNTPAAASSAASNHTSEPTFGAALIQTGINQQTTYTWTTVPEEGFIIPATSAAGIAVRFLTSTSTADHVATIMHAE